MADADILRDLRERVLDESEPLAGLLRKCLALGAVTGSDDLRTWASNELKGYDAQAPLPSYRRVQAQLFIDQRGGPEYATGRAISRFQVPSDLREHVPEMLDFRQPIEELAHMATSGDKSHRMSYAGFSLLAAMWTKKLKMFQSVESIYYMIGPTTFAGIVDNVRTALVEIVIDLARDVPMDALPARAKVDAAVQVHVGSNDMYEVNVGGSNSGVIGQGAGSTQIQKSSVSKELVDLIGTLRAALPQVADDEQRAEATQAIEDFEESVTESDPKPEKVKRRWAILERLATAFGSAAITEAVKEGAPVVMDHLQLLM